MHNSPIDKYALARMNDGGAVQRMQDDAAGKHNDELEVLVPVHDQKNRRTGRVLIVNNIHGHIWETGHSIGILQIQVFLPQTRALPFA